MLFPALPGLLLIASGYGIAEQTLLPVAQNSRDVMLLPCVGAVSYTHLRAHETAITSRHGLKLAFVFLVT